MSELKAFDITVAEEGYCEGIVKYRRAVYDKSEADKVIAELEESHKKEVEQLLMEIVKLKADYKEACDRLQTANLIKDEQLTAARHQKYKRCLAMARISQDDWHLHNSFYAMGHQEFEKRKCEFYEKWHKRWLELAEKFKPNKEAK
jgi:hypothetical protein